MEVFIALILLFGCGWWASDIGRRKGRSAAVFFVLGFALPVIGVIAAALIPPGPAGPAPVMRVMVCPRCNSRQDVDERDGSFRCWQCRTVSPVTTRPVAPSGDVE